MTFSGDRYESFAAPEIAAVRRSRTTPAMPFLLLHGAEPDYAWERFVAAVARSWSSGSGVTSVVALQAIPMPVPHTRPVTVTAHATRRQLIESYPVYWGEMRIPGSVSAPAGAAAGRGRASTPSGVAAHVPHYLAQATYPAASLTLLEHLERLTGLHLPTEALREAAEANRTEIDEQIGRSSREHRRRRRAGAAVRLLHRRPRGHRAARRQRRGAQRARRSARSSSASSPTRTATGHDRVP